MAVMTIRAFIVAVVLNAGISVNAEAQWDCGNKCRSCGSFNGKEGYEHSGSGIYNMTCYNQIPNCVSCVVERANDGDDAERLLAQITTVSESALRALILKVPGRVFLSPDQSLVLLRGTKCDSRAVATVAAVSKSRAAALRRAGIALLQTGHQGD